MDSDTSNHPLNLAARAILRRAGKMRMIRIKSRYDGSWLAVVDESYPAILHLVWLCFRGYMRNYWAEPKTEEEIDDLLADTTPGDDGYEEFCIPEQQLSWLETTPKYWPTMMHLLTKDAGESYPALGKPLPEDDDGWCRPRPSEFTLDPETDFDSLDGDFDFIDAFRERVFRYHESDEWVPRDKDDEFDEDDHPYDPYR